MENQVKEIYFETTNNGLVTSDSLCRMASVVFGEKINNTDFEAIRDFAKRCNGVVKEVEPSVDELVSRGEKVTAIRVYMNNHPGTRLIEARNIVEAMATRIAEEKKGE